MIQSVKDALGNGVWLYLAFRTWDWLPLCEMSEANRLLVEQVADATLASLR